jgi:hypothetical protein
MRLPERRREYRLKKAVDFDMINAVRDKTLYIMG